MLSLDHETIRGFFRHYEETRDPSTWAVFTDWLQEQDATFADVLLLFAGTSNDDPRLHHTNGVPREVLVWAAKAMPGSYPNAGPSTVYQRGCVNNPQDGLPAPSWELIATSHKPRYVSAPAFVEQLARLLLQRRGDPREDCGFVGFVPDDRSVLEIGCRDCARHDYDVAIRRPDGLFPLGRLLPPVRLWQYRVAGSDWHRHYWVGSCERCGWIGWAKEDDGAEERELRRRVLKLFAGLPVVKRQASVSDRLVRASRGPAKSQQAVARHLLEKGFRLDLHRVGSACPVVSTRNQREACWDFTQTITAEHLIPPEPWEEGPDEGPYRSGESPPREAYESFRRMDRIGPFRSLALPDGPEDRRRRETLQRMVEGRLALAQNTADRLRAKKITRQQAIRELRGLMMGDERQAERWLEAEESLHRSLRAGLPADH